MRLPTHEGTTAQLGALYPAVVPRDNGASRVLVGRELSGELFCHDPFDLYRLGWITNPNLVVLGQIGRGKSAFVKTYLYRQAAFGRRIVVLDPKGEYGPLARALGQTPLLLRPGGSLRLNPLVPVRTSEVSVEQRRRTLAAAVSVGEAVLGRAFRPGEHLATELALDSANRSSVEVTFGSLVRALLDPDVETARGAQSSVAELRAEGRELAFELRRFVTGELAGMFDGPTSKEIDLGAPALVLDLAAIYRSPALGPVLACAQAAIEGGLRYGPQRQTLLVVDEAWAVLGNVGAARFLQSSFKLARSLGIANVLVTHRVSDLAASGAEGSVVARLAEGLLADCETVVCFAQSEQETPHCAAAFGLSTTEQQLLPTLRRGMAIWHVGAERRLVEHGISAVERRIIDTDSALFAEGNPRLSHEE